MATPQEQGRVQSGGNKAMAQKMDAVLKRWADRLLEDDCPEEVEPPVTASMVTAWTHRFGRAEDIGAGVEEELTDSLKLADGIDTDNGHVGAA